MNGPEDRSRLASHPERRVGTHAEAGEATTVAAIAALEEAREASGGAWRPSEIAGALAGRLPGGEADAFRAILTAPDIAARERAQAAKCRSAGRKRSQFNWWLLVAVAASTFAAAFGGLQIFKGLTWETWPAGAVVAGFQLAFLTVASVFWLLLWLARPYRGWLADRGEAETLRRDIFGAVIHGADAASRVVRLAERAGASEGPGVRQLALEYFRVCLLDDQIAWFVNKSNSARVEGVAIGIGRATGLVLIVAATLASALAGIAQFAPGFLTWFEGLTGFGGWTPDGTLATLLTVIGASLLTAAQSADSALLSERNRYRYREMANTLSGYRAQELAGARLAARSPAPGSGVDEAGLFTMRVNELLAMEHAEWKAVLDYSTRQVAEQVPGVPGKT